MFFNPFKLKLVTFEIVYAEQSGPVRFRQN